MAVKFFLEGKEIGVQYDSGSDRSLSADEAQVVALGLIAKALEELAAAQRAATSLKARQG